MNNETLYKKWSEKYFEKLLEMWKEKMGPQIRLRKKTSLIYTVCKKIKKYNKDKNVS